VEFVSTSDRDCVSYPRWCAPGLPSIGTNVSNVYTDERVKEKNVRHTRRHEEQEGGIAVRSLLAADEKFAATSGACCSMRCVVQETDRQ
jgi:hypothetical protein